MSWIEVKTHPSKSIRWWFNEFRRGRINMEPGYQRRSNLWGRWKKAHLIDSVLNGFDVPKFYVADFNRSSSLLNESDKPYAVIDGKQRFEALFAFLSGDFSLNASARYTADADIEIAGLDIFELRSRFPTIADRLEEFEPVVMSVATDAAGMIEELFVRLNSGVSINGAERRNAMPGPIPPAVRDITVHPFFGEHVKFSKDRMQEFNLAAKLLLFEFNGGFAETKARNLDAFVTEAEKATAEASRKLDTAMASRSKSKISAAQQELETLLGPYKAAEESVLETLDAMTKVFKQRDPLLAKQGAIPVYYWVLRKNKRLRGRFRQFLEQFEASVMDNVRIARSDPDNADAELLSYYSAARTSNDKSSMEARYRILLARYKEWAQN